ncbi:MAG: bifunctional phosphopantothenoylcysteine decarboxylase/phosphopantothenate--cysteine ligase CoaBC [Anaerolineae bacterium]
MSNLTAKRLVLGVTGSIAAYKAAIIASQATQAGADVRVVMTEAALRMVGAPTFAALTHNSVVSDMWEARASAEIAHVTLGRSADVVLIAPLSANTLAKLALGLADNELTALCLSTRAPLVLAPAMETGMWEHPAIQAHLATLQARGAHVVAPGVGNLASGAQGLGRLADPDTILDAVRFVLGRNGDLAGRRVIVTAGGTREPIDPVRYVSNHSSGKMGLALAEAARDRGADVTLIHTTEAAPPYAVTEVRVASAAELRQAVLDTLPLADALVMAAAPADFTPAHPADRKIKKSGDNESGLTLEMTRTPDILREVAAWRAAHADGRTLVVVGFAAETHDLLDNARAKLDAKRLDLIVANPVPQTFGSDLNQATLLDNSGGVYSLEPLPKGVLADRILDRVAARLRASAASV